MTTVCILSEHDSISELTRLLHAAHAQLAALGFTYAAADQFEDVTRRRISEGECHVVVEDGRMIGSILFRRSSHGRQWYEQPHVAPVHQFGVLPDRQCGGICFLLMRHADQRATSLGASEIALDTAEGATHLINWYGRMGHRRVAIEQREGRTYCSPILSTPLTW